MFMIKSFWDAHILTNTEIINIINIRPNYFFRDGTGWKWGVRDKGTPIAACGCSHTISFTAYLFTVLCSSSILYWLSYKDNISKSNQIRKGSMLLCGFCWTWLILIFRPIYLVSSKGIFWCKVKINTTLLTIYFTVSAWIFLF